MTDREFLVWLHNRLEHVHGENPHVDYMYKLRSIIITMDPKKNSNQGVYGSLGEVLDEVRKEVK